MRMVMTRGEINKEICEIFGRALLRANGNPGRAVESFFLDELEKSGLTICPKNYLLELEDFKIVQILRACK
jgi:hypothetical protein